MKIQSILFFTITLIACNNKPDTSDKQIISEKTFSTTISYREIENFTMKFYKEYVEACQKKDRTALKDVQNKFSTKCLIEDVTEHKLNFDPYINATDCDSTLIKTINLAILENSEVYVSYGKGQEYRVIELKLVFKNRQWLIDGLKVGKNSNILLGCW